jgi:hypothetical protein
MRDTKLGIELHIRAAMMAKHVLDVIDCTSKDLGKLYLLQLRKDLQGLEEALNKL